MTTFEAIPLSQSNLRVIFLDLTERQYLSNVNVVFIFLIRGPFERPHPATPPPLPPLNVKKP